MPSLYEAALGVYRRTWVLPRLHREYRTLPTAEVFRRVYAKRAWGGGSGSGSYGEVADAYCKLVADFVRDYRVAVLADLGCGDFEVGRRIVELTGVRYAGVDIVPELIEHHRQRFSTSDVQFHCLNVAEEALPKAQVCVVRQVLQHLSNAEITAVLANIRQYPMALISEHVPNRPRSFNRDKPHGPDVRAYYGSGVYVDRPPFSLRVAREWLMPLEPGSTLRTVLIAER